ncbi:MAG TPA: trypsin-like peptidase domain-containing protein [Terriglobales bacterium]|nr:trypsin-like peptidase domain-containing protein [Terriglobales bacterium]
MLSSSKTLLALSAVLLAVGCGKGKPLALPQLVQAVRESIVRIEMVGIGTKSEGELNGDPPLCQNAPDSSGTGFIVSPEGHILTNNHVVEAWATCRRTWPNVPMQVHLSGGEIVNATLVGRDPDTDLAVVKINKQGLRALSFADFAKIEIGQDVVAIGFPRPGQIAGAPTVTKGIVSARERALEQLADLIQTDATINGGNSGGPLLNLFGEVVGVNTLRLRTFGRIIEGPDGAPVVDVDVSEGTNFAVSSRIAARVSSDIIANGAVSRANLGVTRGFAITDSGALIRRLQGQPFSVGILVDEIAPGTPAAKILGKCDVIEQLGSYRIANIGDLSNALIWLRRGETVKIQYRRYPPDKCAPLPRVRDPYFDPSPNQFFRPRLSDPESFRSGPFEPPVRARDYQRPFERYESARRFQILAAHRDEGKALTAEITLQ